MPQVIFRPHSVTAQVESGTSLLEAAHIAGVSIRSDCGGQGTCGLCVVEIQRGKCERLSSRHQLPEGQVLACRSVVQDENVEVYVPEASRDISKEVAVSEAERPPIDYPSAESLVSRCSIEVSEPSLDDHTADAERLLRGLCDCRKSDCHIPLDVLRDLPMRLREANWRPNLLLGARPEGWHILDVCPSDAAAPAILVVDVGTTSLKGALLSEKGFWKAACANAQRAYGPDVITRIIHCEQHEGGLQKLNRLVVEDINRMLDRLLEESGVEREDVWAVVASGNTTMVHFLLGMYPSYIRREPYVGASYRPPPVEPKDLGIDINPGGQVFVLPCVSSYVGADITAGVLATELHKGEEPGMLIDLGTNGEIVVGNREFMVCCSASAGPAFEGAGSASGTWAQPGAISAAWDDDELHWETLEDRPPLGICGSGYIDLLASLLRLGVINKTGEFVEDSSSALRRGTHGILEYVLVEADDSETGRDIVLSQADVDNLVRSKGAIYAAGKVLLDSLGMKWSDLGRIMLAGGFGENIHVHNAVTIGLLPDVDPERIEFVGNTSLTGAVLAAGDATRYWGLREIASGMTYFELSTHPEYMDEFVSACFLPHTDTEDFPSVSAATKD